jgi:hypothetical protein
MEKAGYSCKTWSFSVYFLTETGKEEWMKGCGKGETFRCQRKYQVAKNARYGDGRIRGKGRIAGESCLWKNEVEVRAIRWLGGSSGEEG